MAKLFDSMAALKFEQDESGEPTKNAIGMFSKDKEYVDFDEPCQCVGQVSMRVYYAVACEKCKKIIIIGSN